MKEIDKNTLDNVERVLSQFNIEDSKSTNFRYPVTTSPDRLESIKRNTIDIENFKKVIDKLIYFFDWQWETLSHYQDLKEQMIAEMYSSMY